MKIDRLIGIISVLQNSKKVTAPYLADMFEVSRRTINRDIEDICKAGIPLVTTQGKNGGITVMEGFNIERALLTEDELQSIFIGLKSIDSVSDVPVAKMLSLKFRGSDLNEEINSNINIDLSSFYKESYTKK
ncbi:MAG: HTH domain-containing protein, partial [Clostridia bacterium]|nr:HTH domain-containing protein [Clostridia bacterium]